jgi:hypothetical protein
MSRMTSVVSSSGKFKTWGDLLLICRLVLNAGNKKKKAEKEKKESGWGWGHSHGHKKDSAPAATVDEEKKDA